MTLGVAPSMGLVDARAWDGVAVAAAGGAAAWLAERARDWLGFWERELHAPGFNPFDTLAVAWAIDRALVEHVDTDAAIETSSRGPELVVRPPAGGRRVIYGVRPRDGFLPSLMARLTRTLPSRAHPA